MDNPALPLLATRLIQLLGWLVSYGLAKVSMPARGCICAGATYCVWQQLPLSMAPLGEAPRAARRFFMIIPLCTVRACSCITGVFMLQLLQDA
jgi:hypothetical protein